jgi:predicted Abi (CAAX) family protease
VIRRLSGLFSTIPGPAAWARLLGLLLALLAASWLLDRLGLAPWQPDFAFLLGFGAIAGLGTALAEETVFRGILLKPPRERAAGFGPAALSAILFALWHPFQTLFYHPLWEPYAWRWWFLAGTALLGFLCARFTLSTRSIWPAVALHLLAALGWKTLYGIPSCGLAPCVLYQ